MDICLTKGREGSVSRVSAFWSIRLSRVVEMILTAELEPARALGVLVERVLEPGMTRYQFISRRRESRPGELSRTPAGHLASCGLRAALRLGACADNTQRFTFKDVGSARFPGACAIRLL